MSRKRTFHCGELGDLVRQLRFAPSHTRMIQLKNVERLHDEIDPAVNYPLDYVIYRLTRFRREAGDDMVLVGEALLPDLRLIIDALSKSLATELAEDEPVESVEALARRLNVNTKTIQRWRDLGLRWRWVRPVNAHRRSLGFTRQAVDHFIARHGERIRGVTERGRMTDDQKQSLLHRAQRLARMRDVTAHQIATHLAKRTGWTAETIRLLLQKHDHEHPDDPIIVGRTVALSRREKRLIKQCFRQGTPATQLAREYNRTRSTIYKAVHESRARVLRRVPLPYVASPTFERADADEVILRADAERDPGAPPADASVQPPQIRVTVDDLPDMIQPLYRQPLLDDASARSLFIRFNYLKFKASRRRAMLDRYEPRASEVEQITHWIRQASALRRRLIRQHLPIVLSVARRHLVTGQDQSLHRLLSLLEIGQRELHDAVDLYNATRNVNFTSFLTNRLLRCFATDQQQQETMSRRATRRLSDEQVKRWTQKLDALAGGPSKNSDALSAMNQKNNPRGNRRL